MGRDPRSGRGEGMTQRDRSAVHVELFSWERELALNGAGLRCESFVHLDQVHIVDGETGFGQSSLRCGYGTDSHDCGIDARYSPGDESSKGLQAPVARELFASNHQRGRPISDARCVSGGNDASLSKGGLESSELLGRCVRTHVLVLRELVDLSGFRIRNGNRYDLVVEHSLVPRRFGELL